MDDEGSAASSRSSNAGDDLLDSDRDLEPAADDSMLLERDEVRLRPFPALTVLSCARADPLLLPAAARLDRPLAPPPSRPRPHLELRLAPPLPARPLGAPQLAAHLCPLDSGRQRRRRRRAQRAPRPCVGRVRRGRRVIVRAREGEAEQGWRRARRRRRGEERRGERVEQGARQGVRRQECVLVSLCVVRLFRAGRPRRSSVAWLNGSMKELTLLRRLAVTYDPFLHQLNMDARHASSAAAASASTNGAAAAPAAAASTPSAAQPAASTA